jgi:3-oxoisoapionate decarboxylase
VIAEAQQFGVDGISLQTSFLRAEQGETDAIRNAAGPLELVFAWGAPNGLELGSSPEAAESLSTWIELAAGVSCRTMRIVVGGPSLRPRADEWPNAVPLLRRAVAHAHELGITLALENHGDLTAAQVAALLARVDGLRVCFDSANAARVGDDVLEAAALLAPAVEMVHLKDVEPLANVVDPTAGPCSVSYGEGIIPLRELLEILAAPLILVELGQVRPGTDERRLLAACVDWLRKET